LSLAIELSSADHERRVNPPGEKIEDVLH